MTTAKPIHPSEYRKRREWARQRYPVLASWPPKTKQYEVALLLDRMPAKLRSEAIQQLESSGMRGQIAINYLESLKRGRVSNVTPSGSTPRPSLDGAVDRHAAARRRQADALTKAAVALLTAAREFDNSTGATLRQWSAQLRQMANGLVDD